MYETNEDPGVRNIIPELKERIARLEKVILEMTETIRILSEREERARDFIKRIDEIAMTIKLTETKDQ